MSVILPPTILEKYLKWLAGKPRYVNDNAEIEILVREAYYAGWQRALGDEEIRRLQEKNT